MPSWIRIPITPGDRVTVEIQHSTRPVLQPLIGRLRTVEVLDRHRAAILNDDGTRYQFRGRTVPPVELVEASIFTDPATGGLWAQAYDLPPRDRSPYPLHPGFVSNAEPDGHGGIAAMRACRCGEDCVCGTCGEPLVCLPAHDGLDWWTRSLSKHSNRSPAWCRPSPCPSSEPPRPSDTPDCCAMPMRLAPIAWVCRREIAHQRPYAWPERIPAAR